jgi:hypothetical protein
VDSPLAKPLQIYRPFTRRETRTLREYVANVRELAEMRFFKQVPHRFTFAGAVPFAMDEPDGEDVRAAAALFRQIYTPSEPTSVRVVLNILKKSTHERGGPLRDDAISELRDLRSWTEEILNEGIGFGIVFDHGYHQSRVKPAEILDAYFHGRYMHSGNDLTEVVRRLDEVGLPRFTLYNVMRDLTKAYYVIANVVDRVLSVPELVDSNVVDSSDAAAAPR